METNDSHAANSHDLKPDSQSARYESYNDKLARLPSVYSTKKPDQPDSSTGSSARAYGNYTNSLQSSGKDWSTENKSAPKPPGRQDAFSENQSTGNSFNESEKDSGSIAERRHNYSQRQTTGGYRSRSGASPYRRGARAMPHQRHKMSLKEKLVIQCIICGGILAGVMILNLINSSITANLSHKLTSAITQNNTWESVQTAAGDIIDSAAAMSDSVRAVFGFQDDDGEPQPTVDDAAASDPAVPSNEAGITGENGQTELGINGGSSESTAASPSAPATTPASASSFHNEQLENPDFRIDEDILNQMNQDMDLYNSGAKNPQAPN